MDNKTKPAPLSYWEIQKKQQQISWLLFLLLFLFYLLTTAIISGVILLSLGLFLPAFNLFARIFFFKYVAAVFLISIAMTFINFYQARKNGANFILTNLRAYPPDPQDRYHLKFLNVVEEIRLSSGLSRIKSYVIPTVNINSLSLIDRDNIPAVVVTEGILAEASRDELQAVVAHEVAHIARGDTFLLTLICSISVFYERLLASMEKDREIYISDRLSRPVKKQISNPLAYMAGFLSYLIIRFFTMLISQNRELLADATAVEFSRNPLALARIIYKAHVANSYLGDSALCAPLFLVPPDSRDISENLWDRLFNTHPPLTKRLRILAEMSHRTVEDLLKDIKSQEKIREQARTELKAAEEIDPERSQIEKNLRERANQNLGKDKIWLIKDSQGKWLGPYTLGAMLSLSFFTPAARVKNAMENLEGPAGDFPQVRFALYHLLRNQPINRESFNRCPLCRIQLIESFYEGIRIKGCPVCRGRMVKMDDLGKVFARKEVNFSEKLKEKARAYQEAILNPAKKPSIFRSKKPFLCPECGLQLTIRPFNYCYLLPVHKCYHCQMIWFENDEMELLQILIENQINTPAS